MRLDRASETIGVLESAGLPEPRPANLLFLEGAATLAAGRGDRAATLLASALERAGEVSHFDALPERLGAGLPNLLGTALLERQDLDGAERAFRLAVDRHPTGVEARLGLIGVSLARRLPEQALQELDRLAAECGHRVQAWLAGAQVLSGLSGLAETWVAWLEEALRRFPEHPALVERLAAACLCSGRTAQALALWERVGPRADLAGRFTACLAARRELPEAPVARHAELTAGVLDWCRRLWRQEAWGTLDAVLLGLDRAIARVPGLREPTAEWLERAGQAEAAARVRGL
jgi:tetratricopeptide (TPR) repeat protein